MKKLMKLLCENPKEYDRMELEVCMKNLVVVGRIMRSQKDSEYMKEIEQHLGLLKDSVPEDDPLVQKINNLQL